MGDASKVVPIDKLSVVITLVLAFIVLHEEFNTKSVIGCILIGAGKLLMVLQHNFQFKGGDLEMYAQAIRTPPVYRHRRANNQAHLNMFKGCAFSNEPCDCIKSLKLGDWRMGAACLLAAVVSVASMGTMMTGKNAGLMAEYQAAQNTMSKAGTEYVRGMLPLIRLWR